MNIMYMKSECVFIINLPTRVSHFALTFDPTMWQGCITADLIDLNEFPVSFFLNQNNIITLHR